MNIMIIVSAVHAEELFISFDRYIKYIINKYYYLVIIFIFF